MRGIERINLAILGQEAEAVQATKDFAELRTALSRLNEEEMDAKDLAGSGVVAVDAETVRKILFAFRKLVK